MYGLEPHIWKQIFNCFERYETIEEVVLYGSRAKETHKPASDIDLVIKGEAFTEKDLLRLENDLDDLLLPWKIDLSLLKNITNPDLIDHINRIGIVIFKQTAKVKEGQEL